MVILPYKSQSAAVGQVRIKSNDRNVFVLKFVDAGNDSGKAGRADGEPLNAFGQKAVYQFQNFLRHVCPAFFCKNFHLEVFEFCPGGFDSPQDF